jgi:hypothetical protein
LKFELKAGHQAVRGQQGTAHAYNVKSHRDQERRWVEQAEAAYARFVAGCNPRGPKARTGAAKESDDKGCAAGLAPRALLFATRSPVRDRRSSRSPKEALVDHISDRSRYGARSRGCKPQCRAKLRKPDGSGIDHNHSRAAPGRPCAYCRREPRAARRRNRSRAPGDIGRAVFQVGKSRASSVRKAAGCRKSCRE